MNVQEFIQNYREAFGSKAPLPLLFGYSDTPIATTSKIGGCFFKGLDEVSPKLPRLSDGGSFRVQQIPPCHRIGNIL